MPVQSGFQEERESLQAPTAHAILDIPSSPPFQRFRNGTSANVATVGVDAGQGEID
jgi:hypothetical protein